MKNAKQYEKKIKTLLGGAKKAKSTTKLPDDPVELFIEAILAADVSRKHVQKAMANIKREYIDFNDLRVSLTKEIVECIGKEFPGAREKAEMLGTVLNGIFDRANDATLEYIDMKSKRDIRRHLAELGAHPYAVSCMMLMHFGGHAVPVDKSLLECLEIQEYIHPGSKIEDVQGFLERIIAQKNALKSHEFFREYIVKLAPQLEKKHRAEAEAAEKARLEEERKKAEAEAKAAERAAKKAAREAAKKAAEKAKKAAAKKKAKEAAKKAAKKVAKKAKKTTKKAKKVAKKPKKVAKKAPAAKKTKKKTAKKAKKAAKKTVKKAAKKVAKKAAKKAVKKVAKAKKKAKKK